MAPVSPAEPFRVVPGAEKVLLLLLQPLSEGGTQGHVPDVELMLREYYEARDWDPATGRPSREKLLSLDLEAMAGDLWGPKT